MLRDFTSQAGRLHQARLQDWIEEARRDALLQEARAIKRLRRAIGNGLIALGERIADRPARPQHMADKAA